MSLRNLQKSTSLLTFTCRIATGALSSSQIGISWFKTSKSSMAQTRLSSWKWMALSFTRSLTSTTSRATLRSSISCQRPKVCKLSSSQAKELTIQWKFGWLSNSAMCLKSSRKQMPTHLSVLLQNFPLKWHSLTLPHLLLLSRRRSSYNRSSSLSLLLKSRQTQRTRNLLMSKFWHHLRNRLQIKPKLLSSQPSCICWVG